LGNYDENRKHMRTAITSLFLSVFFAGTIISVQAQEPVPAAKDPHHVMWTNKKGAAKCKDKGSKEKADKCAAKLRTKNATAVQVMAGKCSSM
jgi:hypothetical protein